MLGPVTSLAFRFVRPEGGSCVVGGGGGWGVQWEAEDEPTTRRTGRTPEQAKMARIEKVEVRRIPAQRPEDRRSLQPARQQTRRPICHLAHRPGKETVSIRKHTHANGE